MNNDRSKQPYYDLLEEKKNDVLFVNDDVRMIKPPHADT